MIRPIRGFTLVEMAVVLFIVGLLMVGMMFTLTAQIELRNAEETRRRLEEAREALLSYAIANGRLPCPAVTPTGTNDGLEAPVGGGACTNYTSGFLPARTLGLGGADTTGIAVDAWNNRIRYIVSSGSSPHFTNATTLRSNGLATLPTTLKICSTATGISASACSGTATYVVDSSTSIAAIVFSTGKNGNVTPTSADELANLDNNATFVSRTPTPADSSSGAFDDQFAWITAPALYGRLVSAGILP